MYKNILLWLVLGSVLASLFGQFKVTDETNRKEEFIIEKDGDTFAEPVWVWKKK